MILLDTCVISETLKPIPDTNVINWIASLPDDLIYIPSIVIGELKKGIELLPDSKKKNSLNVWFEQFRDRFQGRILDFNEDLALTWGFLQAKLKLKGTSIPAIDGQIASYAKKHNAVLATRNVSDFKAAEINLFNPWTKE